MENLINRRKFLSYAVAGFSGVALAGAIRPSTVLASSLSSTYYNVKDYGNGSGNQASIQAAINAAAADGGGVVYLPAGIYYINSLILKKKVTLLGEGVGTLLQQIRGTNKAVIRTQNASAFPVAVRSLRIRGNKEGHTGSHGIYLASSSTGTGFTSPDGQHIISQVYIENMGGVGIFIVRDCRGSLIEGCWVKGCQRGIRIDGSDTTVSNCVSRSNAIQGFFVKGGNVRMMNCKTFFNRNGGFYLSGTRSVLVACEAQDNWNYGFYLRKNYITMTGCIADSNQNYGFYLQGIGKYLGGLNLSGITAIGRPEKQTNKEWVGQAIGVRLKDTVFTDCYISGVSRDNRSSNINITGSTLNNVEMSHLIDGRLANF